MDVLNTTLDSQLDTLRMDGIWMESIGKKSGKVAHLGSLFFNYYHTEIRKDPWKVGAAVDHAYIASYM
jgi:hypothetical protein